MKVDFKGFETFNLEKVLSEELKGILNKNKESLEVGFFETAKYQDGKYVADIANKQEFGTLEIPARPFFRIAVSKNQGKWLGIFKNQFLANQDFNLSLNQVGEVARGDIIESIMEINTPPNAKATIKAKGSSKPLIDTGFMRSSVTFRVASDG